MTFSLVASLYQISVDFINTRWTEPPSRYILDSPNSVLVISACVRLVCFKCKVYESLLSIPQMMYYNGVMHLNETC